MLQKFDGQTIGRKVKLHRAFFIVISNVITKNIVSFDKTSRKTENLFTIIVDAEVFIQLG
jgi:hypothetical protein